MGRVVIEAPAPLLEARALLAGEAGLKPVLARCAAYQLACCDTYGLSIEGDLLVVMGFWAHENEGRRTGTQELFMACAAPALVRPHVTALVRAGRLIVRGRAHHGDVHRLVARVSRLDGSGGRLARAMGFRRPLTSPAYAPPGAFSTLELDMTTTVTVTTHDWPAEITLVDGPEGDQTITRQKMPPNAERVLHPHSTRSIQVRELPLAGGVMTFGDALEHMKQGKVAWRRSFTLEAEIRGRDGALYLTEGGETTEWLPRQDDLFADDWQAHSEVLR